MAVVHIKDREGAPVRAWIIGIAFIGTVCLDPKVPAAAVGDDLAGDLAVRVRKGVAVEDLTCRQVIKADRIPAGSQQVLVLIKKGGL